MQPVAAKLTGEQLTSIGRLYLNLNLNLNLISTSRRSNVSNAPNPNPNLNPNPDHNFWKTGQISAQHAPHSTSTYAFAFVFAAAAAATATVRPENVEIVSASESDKVISSPVALMSTIEFNELDSAKLLCRSNGAAPAAKLSWRWRAAGGVDLDLPGVQVVAESSSASQTGFSSSSLIEVRNLDARFHLAELWCSASTGGAPSPVPGLANERPFELTAKVQLLVKCEYAKPALCSDVVS